MRGQGLISQPVGRVVGVPFPEAQALHEVLIQRAIPGHQTVGPGHDGQVGLIAGPQVQEIAHEDPAGLGLCQFPCAPRVPGGYDI